MSNVAFSAFVFTGKQETALVELIIGDAYSCIPIEYWYHCLPNSR